jgi:hypothetical protein
MTGLSALGVFRKDLDFLETVPSVSYENIFRMYSTENTKASNFYYFNILNSVYFPDNIPTGSYYTITLNKRLPWTAISYNEYRTTDLWWIIALANKVYNPVYYPAPGSTLRIIKPEYVKLVFDEITSQTKQ